MSVLYRPYSLSARTYTMWLFGLLGVIAGVLAVVILLARVLIAANSINDKATHIKQLGGSINESTAAVLQLAHTNDVASAILADAQPLTGQLNTTLGVAQSIAGLATSIDGTAGSINNTAGSIEGTAVSIDNDAVSIDNSGATINSLVGTINGKVNTVVGLAQAIHGDSSAIRGTAVSIQHNAKSIDCKVVNLPAPGAPNNCAEGS